MMKNSYMYILPLLLLLMAACDGTDIVNNEEPALVVEGWIANDEYPIVMVSKSVLVDTKENNLESLEDHVIRYAKITVSDGERDVILTGRYDNKYMPPYIYTTTDMKGQVGRRYTLKVEADQYYATAATTIPTPVRVDSIRQQRVESTDSLYKLFAEFIDSQEDNYYCLFYKIGPKTAQYNICGVGVFDDKGLDKNVSYPIYKTSNLSVNVGNKNDVFHDADTVCVQLATIDSDAYEFWSDFQNSISLSNNFAIPYTKNVRTNISGGYGYWTGFGGYAKWIIVGHGE